MATNSVSSSGRITKQEEPAAKALKDNPKPSLHLRVIWKDEHMFELEVKATNARYSGMTNVYDTANSLSAFANSLKGYPVDSSTLFYEAGEKDGYAYFSMKFHPWDYTGRIGVQITLEENYVMNSLSNEKDRITLVIVVEPAAIDQFQKELLRLALAEEGEAVLEV